MNSPSNAGLIGLGVSLGIALLASTWIAAETALAVKTREQTIEVKGYAERPIVSDLAVWNASFTVRGADVAAASARLEGQRATVQAFLDQQAVPEEAIEWLPVQTAVLFGRDAQGMPTNEVEGYALSQPLRVSSGDIDSVTRLSEASAALMRQGIELSAWSPEYFYTKLDDLKIAMLGEATADARARAQELATRSEARIGPLRWARQGVFQITPRHSTEVSDSGQNDTSAREKSIKAVVTVGYALEG
jgi:hypothetical protein